MVQWCVCVCDHCASVYMYKMRHPTLKRGDSNFAIAPFTLYVNSLIDNWIQSFMLNLHRKPIFHSIYLSKIIMATWYIICVERVVRDHGEQDKITTNSSFFCWRIWLGKLNTTIVPAIFQFRISSKQTNGQTKHENKPLLDGPYNSDSSWMSFRSNYLMAIQIHALILTCA